MQRKIGTILAGTVASATLAGAAEAQSRCGEDYEIRPGDTLYSIAQRCRVSLARIMDLNPTLGDPRDIAIGTELRLQPRGTGDGGDEARVDRRPARYEVRPGDTFFSIAQSLGVSLIELMQANEEIDPFALAAGTLLNLPGDEPTGSVEVSPQSGTPGSEVTVQAENLRPSEWVTIGAGPWASEWSALREVRTDAAGDVSASVEVPDWADPGDDLIFAVDTDRGMTFKSNVFDVVARGDGNDGERLVLEGRVAQGAECPVLRTPGGETWSMVSDEADFTTGEYVEVTGRRADMSLCMQGDGTIEVASIDEVQPPQDSSAVTLEGRVARGAECYTLKTPESEVWSLTSGDVEFTRGEYVEVTGQEADMSFCMQGVGTLEVTSIEDVPPPR